MNTMPYRRCGRSGVLLPEVSLGLWHNFGAADARERCRDLIARALELGICHLDVADNYGPPPGAAERCLGELLQREFAARRDELFIATKAGHLMWPGPYGDGGSRKHLIAGLDASLRRLRLDYVDVFYSHRPDPDTPLEETVQALIDIVRSGKALYIGLSKYPPERFRRACALLAEARVPCLVHQFRYNLLDRSAGGGMLPATAQQGVGAIAFSPLAQGVLSGKYLAAAPPPDSRAQRSDSPFLTPERACAESARVAAMAAVAREAGLPLTQLALRWLLAQPGICSVLIGARNLSQLDECAAAAGQPPLSDDLLSALRDL
ncbi:MAG: aldo/keto reductase [Akkermansia sp.]